MYETPQASVEECKLVLSTQDHYWRYYQEVSQQCSVCWQGKLSLKNVCQDAFCGTFPYYRDPTSL